jgi:hypothetical protein
MQRSLKSFGPLPFEAAGTAPFSVVIAYEDFETAAHARKTYDYLVRNLEGGHEFAHQMWKFDVLQVPKMREIAARDAAAADLIIISCRGSADLPEHVKTWNELWLAQKGQPSGLVLLFDAPRDPYKAADVSKYLASIARRGGIEYFSQPSWNKTTSSLSDFDLGSSNGGNARNVFPMNAFDRKNSPMTHWGINE